MTLLSCRVLRDAAKGVRLGGQEENVCVKAIVISARTIAVATLALQRESLEMILSVKVIAFSTPAIALSVPRVAKNAGAIAVRSQIL
ncbi:MAG: hypothetical protein NW224_05730 [Leptolyngbyaceae cyanobacterium bins.302]|nr:hypothetical protein [Leptolyngbyaceae cyanobacterium bins.302]